MKRIAVDLAKSVYQVAESVRAGVVVQRKRLSREAFARYVQEQSEPVEWVMEACGTAHYWGRVAQARGHRVTLLHHAMCGRIGGATRRIATTATLSWRRLAARAFMRCL